ncbi:hypothetical protein HIM_04431 [Hirsutella minnesotensis 3608]|uniref:Uncharacterized protein n=1 Tax=Hirsutella minnesotensis 3608 TaxID=1043627 RepID=A0A0F8A627_9HYPO|nr:hypothetical protein HIM_04431 [Hirsutella minnesotensis 3608]
MTQWGFMRVTPFLAYYTSLTIVNYAGGDKPAKGDGIKEYVYSDKTGDWESIHIIKAHGAQFKQDAETKTSATQTSSSQSVTETANAKTPISASQGSNCTSTSTSTSMTTVFKPTVATTIVTNTLTDAPGSDTGRDLASLARVALAAVLVASMQLL